MFSILAVLIYLVAFCVPVYLLYHFGPQNWFWHLLAVIAALAIGFIPTSPAWKTTALDLIFGSTFISMMTWGIGGFALTWRHRVKHA